MDNLIFFYLTGAIFLLAIVLAVLPTLIYREKNKSAMNDKEEESRENKE